MEIVLKDAKLLAKGESSTNKGRFYDAPQILLERFVKDVIVMSLGDVSGDNEFGDDFV